jgi:hypothetical protein
VGLGLGLTFGLDLILLCVGCCAPSSRLTVCDPAPVPGPEAEELDEEELFFVRLPRREGVGVGLLSIPRVPVFTVGGGGGGGVVARLSCNAGPVSDVLTGGGGNLFRGGGSVVSGGGGAEREVFNGGGGGT